jgi:hypothetical protein
MRTLLAILLAISSSVFAAGSDDLIGNWKLVSWQVIVAARKLARGVG